MARFVFPMESILKLRDRIEEQKKQEFGKAVSKLEYEKKILRNLIQLQEINIRGFKEKLTKSISPLETDRYNNYIKSLKIRIEEQVEIVKEHEKIVEIKREELMLATQEKKKMEKLKERQLEEYFIEEKRREQKITDEIVSYQYNE